MSLKIADELYGFKVLNIENVEDLNGTGFWLVHLKTGMQIFYINCDDSENLFNFSFSTPSVNSTGVAHAIEHSVLCGSKNFPLKSPFLQLNKQSITTFLNALTSADTTMFPASSTVETEYFNVMKVYGDAVFFPKLEKWTFEQEVHRLEIDENEKISVQGVVYNEMKGAYNDFARTYFKQLYKTFLSPSSYAFESGGDPKEILKLTYEDFLHFYKTHYKPSNCKIVLYGNIPLEKQLAFIDENFIKNFDDFQLQKCEDFRDFEAFDKSVDVATEIADFEETKDCGGIENAAQPEDFEKSVDFNKNLPVAAAQAEDCDKNLQSTQSEEKTWNYLNELKYSSLLLGDNRPCQNKRAGQNTVFKKGCEPARDKIAENIEKIAQNTSAKKGYETLKAERSEKCGQDLSAKKSSKTAQFSTAQAFIQFLKPANCKLSNLKKAPKYVSFIGPDTSCKKPSIICNWLIGTRSQGLGAFYEASLLTELLIGFDASPLRKVLTHCKLGNGFDTDKSTLISYLPYTFFCVGVSEVEKNKRKKVEKLIWDTLKDIAENGFDEDLVEMCLLSSDFSVREVGVGSSNSLSISRVSLWGWNNGFTPFDFLHSTAAFEEIKKRIKADKNYLKNLVKKCLIENQNYSCITYVPSGKFKAKIEKAEKNYINSFFLHLNKTQKKEFIKNIKAEQQKLHDFQQQKENDEVLALIPHVKPSDLSAKEEEYSAKHKKIGNIEVFNFETFTNGLVYLDLVLPYDVLDLEDLQFMQALQSALLVAGFNGTDWENSCKRRFLSCADFDVSFAYPKQNDFLSEEEIEKRQQTEAYYFRDLLCWHIETTNEKIEQALDCLFLNVLHPNYEEFKRIEDTFLNKKAQLLDDFVTAGQKATNIRAGSSFNKSNARRELIFGLSQYFNVYAEEKNILLYCKKIEEIYKKILNAGACVFFTSENSVIETIYKKINQYASQFSPLALPKKIPSSLYYEFIKKATPQKNITNGTKEYKNLEYFTANMQVGFASSVLQLDFLSEKQCVALICLLQWFSGDFLWERIRTIGGAYGCHAMANLKSKLISFYTYRDPTPLQSLEVYKNALKELCDIKFDIDTVHRCIASFYSNFTGTLSASDKGGRAMTKVFFGVEEGEIEQIKRILLNLSVKDFEELAKKLSKYVINNNENFCDVIISAKNDNFSGKTVQLAL